MKQVSASALHSPEHIGPTHSFVDTLLPASASPIHWKNMQELDSYNTIPIKQETQQNKIQNKTQNWHLLTLQYGHLQNLLPKWFTPRNMSIIVGTSHLHFTIAGDEDDDDNPPFPFILSPIIPSASFRVWNSQIPPLGFKICNNNQRHENGSHPFLFHF